MKIKNKNKRKLNMKNIWKKRNMTNIEKDMRIMMNFKKKMLSMKKIK